jgi:hypothetical protein
MEWFFFKLWFLILRKHGEKLTTKNNKEER